jgi:hypothetical protein
VREARRNLVTGKTSDVVAKLGAHGGCEVLQSRDGNAECCGWRCGGLAAVVDHREQWQRVCCEGGQLPLTNVPSGHSGSRRMHGDWDRWRHVQAQEERNWACVVESAGLAKVVEAADVRQRCDAGAAWAVDNSPASANLECEAGGVKSSNGDKGGSEVRHVQHVVHTEHCCGGAVQHSNCEGAAANAAQGAEVGHIDRDGLDRSEIQEEVAVRRDVVVGRRVEDMDWLPLVCRQEGGAVRRGWGCQAGDLHVLCVSVLGGVRGTLQLSLQPGKRSPGVNVLDPSGRAGRDCEASIGTGGLCARRVSHHQVGALLVPLAALAVLLGLVLLGQGALTRDVPEPVAVPADNLVVVVVAVAAVALLATQGLPVVLVVVSIRAAAPVAILAAALPAAVVLSIAAAASLAMGVSATVAALPAPHNQTQTN